jgi:hypothetical protein
VEGGGGKLAVKLEHGLPCRQLLKLLVNIVNLHNCLQTHKVMLTKTGKVQVRAFYGQIRAFDKCFCFCGLPPLKLGRESAKALTYESAKALSHTMQTRSTTVALLSKGTMMSKSNCMIELSLPFGCKQGILSIVPT